jgi:hypothetical protein
VGECMLHADRLTYSAVRPCEPERIVQVTAFMGAAQRADYTRRALLAARRAHALDNIKEYHTEDTIVYCSFN